MCIKMPNNDIHRSFMVQVCLKIHFNKESKTEKMKIKISRDPSLLLKAFLLQAAHFSNALRKQERT